MELVFTPHPILQAPTDEEIIQLAEVDPTLLAELHRVHEGTIKSSVGGARTIRV
jgi:hypothetical protein